MKKALEKAERFQARFYQAPRIALETYDITMDRDKSEEFGVKLVPTFVVQSQDGKTVKFSGTLDGVSLLLLVDAITGIAEGRTWFPDKIGSTLKKLSQTVPVQVLLENDCALCKPVAETAVGLAMTSRLVSPEIIVADDYPELLSKLKVKILPFTVFGRKLSLEGHVSESEFLEMLFKAEGQKASGLDVPCMVCGQPSPELICGLCKIKIQAEALNQTKGREALRTRERHGAAQSWMNRSAGHEAGDVPGAARGGQGPVRLVLSPLSASAAPPASRKTSATSDFKTGATSSLTT